MIASALAAAMQDEQFDLILTGLQSDDQGFAQTGVILAERLGSPHATIIMDVQVNGGQALRVKRELEGGWFQWVAMPLPAVLTIQSGINQLRYATLKGIMAAKKKEIRKVVRCRRRDGRDRRSSSLYAPEKAKKTQHDRRLAGRGREGAGATTARGSAGHLMILVIAEQRGGKLNRATWEAIAGGAAAGRGAGRSAAHALLVAGDESRRRWRRSWPRPRCRKS